MYKVNKNDKSFQELNSYAKSIKIPLKDLLMSDEHLEKVCDIFYAAMPKLVRFAMKKPAFIEFYKKNRVLFVKQMNLN